MRENIIKAGEIASKVREETKQIIVEGKSYEDILSFCESKIIASGGEIAWAQLSPTTTAAHFSPCSTDNPICKKGDLVKLDIGVHIEGYIADTAITVLIEGGNDDGLMKDLMKASKKALDAVEKKISPGMKLKELGAIQFNEADVMGFTTIKNLCGHTVDRWKVHGGISIPSFDNGDETEIEEGMIVAIEPFVTNGDGFIHEKGTANVFMQEMEKNTRSQHGRKVLSAIKERNGLPFATRDLENKIGRVSTVLGTRDLLKQNIIRAYPPLVEVSQKPVAQFEHSFLIDKKTKRIT